MTIHAAMEAPEAGYGAARTRVLFMGEAVTLAHVARVHALARQLDARRYEICVAADPRYNGLFGEHAFALRDVWSVSTKRFGDALASGSPLYDVDTLQRYVEEDLKTIESFAPDVVVGDFRLSLNVSARLAGTPYVNIAGAGWSPYTNAKFTVPDLALTRVAGVPVAQALFDLTRRFAFGAHARPLNLLRRRHGMAPLPYDLRVTYTEADRVLYADVPELFSLKPMPPDHDFVGAVLWSPEAALPDWWSSLPADRPLVYVTLGSSGDVKALTTILAALAGKPVTVVVATAGRIRPEAAPANTFVADFLPGTSAAGRSALVVCNGGSATCYQALAAGVPILGIPSNLDQFITMGAIEAAGAGIGLRTQKLSVDRIGAAFDRIMTQPSYRLQAERLKTAIAGRDNATMLTQTLTSVLDGAQLRATA